MLEVKDLFCGYGQGDVVKGVGFTLEKGEVLCLSGPNGCGKTTLLRAVSALLPYTGTVKILGVDIATMKRAQIASKAALLSQQSSVHFPYTVYETVLMGRYLHMKKGFFPSHTSEDRLVVLECIEQVGLSDCLDKNITELSGGQFQRVMLARVFAQEPSIILLDEPTNHLDIKNQVETVEHIRSWVKQGERAALAVFHDINLTMASADRVLLMDGGKILREGSVAQVLSGEEINRVYGMDVGAHMRKILSMW